MNEKTPKRRVKILVTATYLLMVLVNALANILPINGKTTGEVSDTYQNLFAPDGITFGIWGVIYVLLALYVLYQLGGLKGGARTGNRRLLTKIGIIFSISSMINTLWILTWHFEKIYYSVVLMLLLLLCLVYINQQTKSVVLSLREKFFIRLPFSMYYGWITVAAIANITTALVDLRWKGFGFSESLWTALIVVLGAFMCILTMFSQKDMVYGAVFIWAYAGIFYKHVKPDGFHGAYPLVLLAVSVSIFLVVLAEGYIFFTQRKKRR